MERRVSEKEWNEIERRLAAVELAFPDGPEKHRDYHQGLINAAREEAEFWKAAKMELTKIGISTIFGVAKIVGMLALLGLMYKLGLESVWASFTKVIK